MIESAKTNVVELFKAKWSLKDENDNKLSTKLLWKLSFFIFGISSTIIWISIYTQLKNFTLMTEPDSFLEKTLLDLLNAVWCITLLITNLILTCVLFRYSRSASIYWGIIMGTVGYSGIVILMFLNLREWYVLGILSAVVFLMNLSSSFLTSGFLSLVSFFPGFTYSYFIVGQAFSGALLSMIYFAFMLVKIENYLLIYAYSGSGAVFLFLSAFLYNKITTSDKFKNMERSNTKATTLHEKTFKSNWQKYLQILEKKWVFAVTLFIAVSFTNFIFPNICTSIVPTTGSEEWKNKYYYSFGVFIVFFFGDLGGRYIDREMELNEISFSICMISILRFIHYPLYLLCYRSYDQAVPNLLKNDAFPVMLNLILGITHGFIYSNAISSSYDFISSDYQSVCSMLMVNISNAGVFMGIILSYAFN